MLNRTGRLSDPLREGVGNGGCGGAKVRTVRPVIWKFWQEEERVAKFITEGIKTTLFLAKWLTLAFLLESLMMAWLPAELIARSLGGSGLMPIIIATLVGVPAYLNGYAALPLVGELIRQGMTPGAGQEKNILPLSRDRFDRLSRRRASVSILDSDLKSLIWKQQDEETGCPFDPWHLQPVTPPEQPLSLTKTGTFLAAKTTSIFESSH